MTRITKVTFREFNDEIIDAHLYVIVLGKVNSRRDIVLPQLVQLLLPPDVVRRDRRSWSPKSSIDASSETATAAARSKTSVEAVSAPEASTVAVIAHDWSDGLREIAKHNTIG